MIEVKPVYMYRLVIATGKWNLIGRGTPSGYRAYEDLSFNKKVTFWRVINEGKSVLITWDGNDILYSLEPIAENLQGEYPC